MKFDQNLSYYFFLLSISRSVIKEKAKHTIPTIMFPVNIMISEDVKTRAKKATEKLIEDEEITLS